MLTKEQILACKEPEDLFSRENHKSLYKDLARQWHPDRSGGSDVIFAKVNTLYDKVRGFNDSDWKRNGIVMLEGDAHHYLLKDDFELGTCYVLRSGVVIELLPDNMDLLENYYILSRNIAYSNDKIKAEMSRYLPGQVSICRQAVKVQGLPGYIRLKDVGILDAKHVAWIVSRLLNFCCFLKSTRLTHNALTTENVFILPESHQIQVLGGWFYAVPEGGNLKAAPYKAIEYGPYKLRTEKKGRYQNDLEMVKALARELLGSIDGVNLQAPKSMVDYLTLPAGYDPLEEFDHWYNTVLDKAFGAKTFVVLDMSQKSIYRLEK